MLPKVPKYDGKESISIYEKKVAAYTTKLMENKYNVILKFINELMSKNDENMYKSLIQFKKVSRTKLSKNLKKSKEVIKKYIQFFKNDLRLDFDDSFNDVNYIVYCLTKILKAIGYKFVKYQDNKDTYYTITIR
jgi:hypothetical protein